MPHKVDDISELIIVFYLLNFKSNGRFRQIFVTFLENLNFTKKIQNENRLPLISILTNSGLC